MLKRSPLLFGVLFMLSTHAARAQEDSIMFVHYINVGQAAAVLLEFPCGAMLIDAGAQDDDHDTALVHYLGRFFAKRKDLDSTLDLVMVTHPHIDHNYALKDVAQTFHIKHYIDDGLRVGSGKTNQKWMQDNAAARGFTYRSYSWEQITKNGNKKGLTDTVIDPIHCTTADPRIILYCSRFEKQPDDWTATDFKNYNNHSLVVKVLFGKASFLFTGDLETAGLQSIIDEYAGTKALDVDVLMVGHHGAGNATTEDYLSAVTPQYAVISCGQWDFGKDTKDPFTTWAYGHPRVTTVDMLEENIPGSRQETVTVKAADGSKDFRNIKVDKNIYATPWDQTIVIRASKTGHYAVSTDN